MQNESISVLTFVFIFAHVITKSGLSPAKQNSGYTDQRQSRFHSDWLMIDQIKNVPANPETRWFYLLVTHTVLSQVYFSDSLLDFDVQSNLNSGCWTAYQKSVNFRKCIPSWRGSCEAKHTTFLFIAIGHGEFVLDISHKSLEGYLYINGLVWKCVQRVPHKVIN